MKATYEGVKDGDVELGRRLLLEVARKLEPKVDGLIAGLYRGQRGAKAR